MRKASKAITVRVEDELYETLVKLAETNHQTITHLVTGCVESAVEIINAEESEPDIPQFLALCRLSVHWTKTPKNKLHSK